MIVTQKTLQLNFLGEILEDVMCSKSHISSHQMHPFYNLSHLKNPNLYNPRKGLKFIPNIIHTAFCIRCARLLIIQP